MSALRRNGAVVLAWAAACALGCESPQATELLVVVDSNLPIPDQLDGLRVESSGAMGSTASGALGGPGRGLPQTIGLVYRGGDLGPITIDVIGTFGGTEVIRGRAITSFIEGRTLILPVMLSRACTGVTCGAGMTCSSGECVSASVDPATLQPWSGGVPRLDGGSCVRFDERCNERDDDCDGRIDEDFDLQTDSLHCGGCGMSCERDNAVVGCAAGACTFDGCQAGFGDCNATTEDGCEVDLTTRADHCGACGAACPAIPNATPACVGAACAIGACDAGWADCDGDPTNGCERPLVTLTDCGACDVACSVTGATATCATGTCQIASCDVGLGDCDGDTTNGCERPLDTLTDCGACDATCDVASGTESCATLECKVEICDTGFADCNGLAIDGCERPITTLTDCGGCRLACSVANGTATCATGSCEIAACDVDSGDCDGDPANGCETDLSRTEAHCGACGSACPIGKNCRFGICY